MRPDARHVHPPFFECLPLKRLSQSIASKSLYQEIDREWGGKKKRRLHLIEYHPHLQAILFNGRPCVRSA